MKTAKFIIRRVISGALTLLLLITLVFFMIRLLPGSPFQSNAISEQTLQAIQEQYHLNEPVWTQYRAYIGNLFHGDLGVSYLQPQVRVVDILARSWPNTLRLGLAALLLALLLGVLCAVIQENTRSRFIHRLISVLLSVGLSIPNFVLAIALATLFGARLKWLPVVGLSSGVHYILPVLALAFYPMAMIAKMTRSSYAQALKQEYVLFARAKGLSHETIVFRYALKQAMIPVVSMMGPMVAFLLTGSFVVESVFSIPGLGMEFVQSIYSRDYTLIMGLVLVMGSVVIVVHTVSDIICAGLDARMTVLQP